MARISNAVGTKTIKLSVFPRPVIRKRKPLTTDMSYPDGQTWIYQEGAGLDDVYILSSKRSGSASWLNMGGGSGSFASLTVTGAATVGTALTLTAGSLTLGALTAGTVRTSAAGVVSTLADGAIGTVLIGTTAGGVPVWSTLTAGAGIVIDSTVSGAITITNPGATGTTIGTDVAGPVSPDGAGLTTFEGYDANITTDGGTANTVKIRLADDIVSVGTITASTGFEVSAGSCEIISNVNAAGSITLHADGGTAESIWLHSDQGTGTDSIILSSDVGGVSITSGFAGADSLTFDASHADGGMDFDCGTAGYNMTAINGPFSVFTGSGAMFLGTDAAAKNIALGNGTGATSLTLASGTGDLVATSTDAITITATGIAAFESSAGIINIGATAVDQNINLGTAGERTITAGNSTGATALVFDCGTGEASFATNATAHVTTVGSTNTTCTTTVQSGTNPMTFTAGGTFDVNAVGNITVESSAGTINIGATAVDQNMNFGTGGAARTIIAGNVTGGTSIVLNVGTGNLDLGVSATSHTTRVGSTSGTSNLVLQAGTGSCLGTFGGILDINVAGDITMDSSGGTMSFGNEAVAQAMNFGTGAAARAIIIGNATDATSVVVNAGTGASSFAANATDHTTSIGSVTGVSATTVQAGTGGLTLSAAGIIDVPVVTDTQAASAVTINANAGLGTFTGLTTAAAGTQVLTVTNSLCTAGSAILCTLANLGANDSQCTVTRVVPDAGSFTVTYQNLGAASLNGNLLLTFWILTA